MNRPKSNNKELKLYNETGILRCMKVFFQLPEKEFTLSDLASEAQVAKQNIKKIAVLLHSQGLIDIDKWGKRIWRIKARQEEWKFLKARLVYNISQLYERGFVEVIEKIFDRPRVISVFGSYRYGNDISTSDIDIAIETSFIKEYSIMNTEDLRKLIPASRDHIEMLKNLEEAFGRQFQFHLFNRKDFHKEGFRNNVFNGIVNGIVLYGFLDIQDEKRKS